MWIAEWRSRVKRPLPAGNPTPSCPRLSSCCSLGDRAGWRWHSLFRCGPCTWPPRVWGPTCTRKWLCRRAICHLESEVRALKLWLSDDSDVFWNLHAIVRWSSEGWGDCHYLFLFWTKCSEFLELASRQLYLPLLNHSIDSSAQTRVIRPKIYHPEAYFNYPK